MSKVYLYVNRAEASLKGCALYLQPTVRSRSCNTNKGMHKEFRDKRAAERAKLIQNKANRSFEQGK